MTSLPPPVAPCPADAPQAAPGVVIDTQVVMDWLVFDDARARPLAQAVLAGQVRWLVTAAMQQELHHVLGRGVAANYGPDLAHIDAHFARYARDCPPAAPSPRLVCRDPDDQKFIDLALEQGARWLISRDKAVLALAKRARARGLAVLKPEQWVLA